MSYDPAMRGLVMWLSDQPQWIMLALSTLLGLLFVAAVGSVWAFGYMLLAVSERPGNEKSPAVPPPVR